MKVRQSAKDYATEQPIKSLVKGRDYEIVRVKDGKLLLSKIVSWVYEDDVEKVSDDPQSLLVETICDELNVRQKNDYNSKVVTTEKRGEVYTIITEENELGKLKSGIGYISMNEKYVKRK